MQQAGNFNLSAAYTTANHLPASDGYTYDAAGDLTADGIGNTFSYDTDGHVILSNGADAYNYGADGHLAYSTTGAGETDYLYLGDRLVGKYQPGSGNWTDMIYGNGSLIATVAGTQTAVPDYRFGDHLGSLAVLTDGSGNVLETNTFLPFGQQLSGGTLDPFLFTGLERESDTGTDRALYRQYDSTEDRWLTPDQYHGSYDLTDPQSFNRYAYVNGRPTFYTDPTGLDGGGCGFTCIIGIDIVEDIGVILGLDELFGPGPSFHGSLHPRPSTNDPGSFGESLGIPTGLSIPNPGVTGALGLPTGDGCEFGACGPGASGFGAGQQDAGSSSGYQPLPPLIPIAGGIASVSRIPQPVYSKSYTSFVACEIGLDIGNIDEQATPELEKEEPYTFAVVNSAPFVFAAKGQEVRAYIALGVQAVYDISLAIRSREECAKAIYGPGTF